MSILHREHLLFQICLREELVQQLPLYYSPNPHAAEEMPEVQTVTETVMSEIHQKMNINTLFPSEVVLYVMLPRAELCS